MVKAAAQHTYTVRTCMHTWQALMRDDKAVHDNMTYVQTRICQNTSYNLYILVHTHTHTHIHAHIHTDAHMRARTHTHTHIHTHTHMHAHIHADAHMRACTHTHMYTRTRPDRFATSAVSANEYTTMVFVRKEFYPYTSPYVLDLYPYSSLHHYFQTKTTLT